MTNIVLLAGNIGNDPETATTRDGTRITDFRL
ncbi:MAG: single-stranded DNA-binding protein, partial [Mesorhizobium sp.]